MKNPIDTINKLTNAQFKLSVLNSVLWSCDIMTLNATRYLLQNEIGDTEFKNPEEWNAVRDTKAAIDFAASIAHDMGLQHQVDDIRALMAFAEDIEEAITAAATQASSISQPTARIPQRKSYLQLLDEERPRMPDEQDTAKIQAMAEDIGGTEAEIAEFVQQMQLKAETDARNLAARNAMFKPMVIDLLETFALKKAPDFPWAALSEETQSRLITAVSRAVDSTKARAATWKSVRLPDYQAILVESKAAKAELVG